MKCLIVYAHPNPNSFNNAVKTTIESELKLKGHEVIIRDLYKLGFDPVFKPHQNYGGPDAVTEQNFIKQADTIIFVYPIWWTSMPAVLKGYFDKVLLKDFAYSIEKDKIIGLLSNKKAAIFNTTGTPEPIYKQNGMFKSLNQIIEEGILKFCGIETILHKYFCAVPFIANEERKNMLKDLKKDIAKLINLEPANTKA